MLDRRTLLALAASATFIKTEAVAASTDQGWSFPEDETSELARMTPSQRATLAIFRAVVPRMADAPTMDSRGAAQQEIINRLEKARLPRKFTNWSATVDKTDVDDERALIFLKIGKSFVARTAFLSIVDTENTAILPGSKLYKRARSFMSGQPVRFDGYLAKFLLDGRGDTALPVAFLMRFADIRQVT